MSRIKAVEFADQCQISGRNRKVFLRHYDKETMIPELWACRARDLNIPFVVPFDKSNKDNKKKQAKTQSKTTRAAGKIKETKIQANGDKD